MFLNSLDRLEGEGWLYSRKEIEPDLFMYVGIDRAFRFNSIERNSPHKQRVRMEQIDVSLRF